MSDLRAVPKMELMRHVVSIKPIERDGGIEVAACATRGITGRWLAWGCAGHGHVWTDLDRHLGSVGHVKGYPIRIVSPAWRCRKVSRLPPAQRPNVVSKICLVFLAQCDPPAVGDAICAGGGVGKCFGVRSFVDPWLVERSYGCCILCEDRPDKEAAGSESEKSDLLMCECMAMSPI